jgi:FkbM family methyltransferase
MGEPVHAVTSLSPASGKAARQRTCIESWIKAGLRVTSLNHPSEIAALARAYPIDFVPVEKTTDHVFGRPFVAVHSILDWAAGRQIMLMNGDIELCLSSWELTRVRRLCNSGLCYLIRHNRERGSARLSREPWGIDAFLIDGRDAALFEPSFLSIGQPFWDYWIPYVFAAAGRPIFTVEFPAAVHENHPQQWGWEAWHRCALEFDRMARMLGTDKSRHACLAMSLSVRAQIDRATTTIARHPFGIRAWMESRFSRGGKKIFLELGAHEGEDTAWMAALPDTLIHAFEPDPRNNPPPLNNVVLHRLAVGDRNGRSPFVMSKSGWGREWTYSSSIKPPKNHLQRYPVTFGDTVEVAITTLDSFCRRHGLDQIDFIWADIQGAEGEMIRGGRETLAKTRYLYTEYSDDELYEGQITLAGILELLPDFRVVEIWPDDVLLENRRLAA